eukprot:SAG31_NODE_4550_length_3145_cov_2.221274_4_plen_39_part_00
MRLVFRKLNVLNSLYMILVNDTNLFACFDIPLPNGTVL